VGAYTLPRAGAFATGARAGSRGGGGGGGGAGGRARVGPGGGPRARCARKRPRTSTFRAENLSDRARDRQISDAGRQRKIRPRKLSENYSRFSAVSRRRRTMASDSSPGARMGSIEQNTSC